MMAIDWEAMAHRYPSLAAFLRSQPALEARNAVRLTQARADQWIGYRYRCCQ